MPQGKQHGHKNCSSAWGLRRFERLEKMSTGLKQLKEGSKRGRANPAQVGWCTAACHPPEATNPDPDWLLATGRHSYKDCRYGSKRSGEKFWKVQNPKWHQLGWEAASQKIDHPAHILNDQVDSVGCLSWRKLRRTRSEMEIFIEMAAGEAGYSGMKELLREVISRGWPVTWRACETVTSVCS